MGKLPAFSLLFNINEYMYLLIIQIISLTFYDLMYLDCSYSILMKLYSDLMQ